MMKKSLAALGLAALVVLPLDASADQGFFGGRPAPDGSLNMRRSTTEQFDPIRGQSVAQRPRPDFDPTPIDISSFQLFPAISASSYYDSNIYSTQGNVKDDVVWKINPTLAATSNWGRHAIAFTGMADINQYTQNDSENFVGGVMQAEGRYDIAPQTWASATAGYQRVTEPRSFPSSPTTSAAEPTQYNLTTMGGELYRGLGQLKMKANYDFSYYEYDAAVLTGGGVVSQSGRDRASNAFSTEVSYAYTENLIPFIRGSYDVRDYVISGVRNSTGYSADVGAHLDFGGVTSGSLYVGYINRDYYNFGTGNHGALDVGGDVLWNVTELTSIQGEFGRTIEETTAGTADSFTSTGGSLTVTHELLRNVILEGNLSYSNYDFNSDPRQDDIYGAGAGSRYFITRNFYADLTYDYSKRDSNAAGGDYDKHTLLIRFGAQH
jgi:hypothetical protein